MHASHIKGRHKIQTPPNVQPFGIEGVGIFYYKEMLVENPFKDYMDYSKASLEDY